MRWQRVMGRLTLLGLTFLVLLAGCGPQETANGPQGGSRAPGQGGAPPEKPAKLVVWENDDPLQLANTKTLANQYEIETGIQVEVIAVPLLKQQDKLTLDGPAGKGPDLVTWPHDRIGEAVLKGLIQPIQVEDEVKNAFTESSIQALTYDGQLYGLPKTTESIALIYNKKWISRPPETFEELVAFAKAHTNPQEKKYGLLYEAANFYYSYFLFTAHGGYVFKADGGRYDTQDIGLNNDGSQKAVATIRQWFQEGLMPKSVNADVVNGLFKEGKVAAVINGPWAIKDYQKAGIDLGVAPIPTINGKHPQTFIGVKGWYLSAYSQNAYWATDLMKFLTSKAALQKRFQETGEIPPRKDLMDDPLIQNDPIVNGFAQQADYGTPMPNVPEMGPVWEPIGNAITFVAQGKQEPKKALDDAVKQIQQRIAAQKQ